MVAVVVWSSVYLLAGPELLRADDIKPEVGFGIALTGPSGVYSYVPDKWGVLHVHLVNRKQVPLELLAATYFEHEKTLQYGRRVWMPPRSRMVTWHPAKLPPQVAEGGKVFKFYSLVKDADQAGEDLIRTESGQMLHDGMLQVGDARAATGLIQDLGTPAGIEDLAIENLIETCRGEQELLRRLTLLSDPIFAPGDASLQSLDQLVVSSNRANNDAAGLTSIRRWLYGGGRLWVLLDRVDPRFLERLLGDELQCEVVDRVSLTTLHLDPTALAIQSGTVTEEHERPVELVRVLVSDVDVVYTTDGWPAAFWKTCGEGRLLVTTLGARGWMRPREAGSPPVPPREPSRAAEELKTDPRVDPRSGAQSGMNSFKLNDPMANLAAEFWSDRKTDVLPAEVLEPLVQEYIGYAVPARWLISGLLLGFSVTLAGLGIWLWRAGRLEWLGVVGPALSIGVSLVLVLLGRQQRQAVPPTVAEVQFAQAVTGTDDVLVQGQMGLFAPDAGSATLGSHHGGWVVPDMAGMQGTTRRMIWTDLDQWEWQNLPQVAGSRNATLTQSAALSERLSAEATFGPRGLTGRLHTGGRHHPEDAIIATNSGRIGVRLNGDGTFTAHSDQVFSEEQFLGAELLSDEQNRRRRVLRHMLEIPQPKSDNDDDQRPAAGGMSGDKGQSKHKATPKRIDYPRQPQLMFWTAPWDLGLRLPGDARTLGATLVAVPLKLQRPPAGTMVSLASPLLPYAGLISRNTDAAGSMWDRRTRTWQEKDSRSTMWLKFQLPRELLPVDPVSGRLVVRVTGPMRQFDVAGGNPTQTVPLKSWIDPVGTLTLDITDPAVLTPDREGALLLQIAGGDPRPPDLTSQDDQHGGDNKDGGANRDGRNNKDLSKTSAAGILSRWRIESLTLDLNVKTR